MKATNAFFGTLAIAFVFSAPLQAQFLYTTIGETITITGYTGSGGDVVISPTINGLPVTQIGNYAFDNSKSLTSVTIGNSVTSIGGYAFAFCSSLTNVTISNSVTSIGDEAFLECSNLTSVTIGNGVTSIGENAFLSCTSLTSVKVPNSVTSIGYGAFNECPSLTRVTIGNGVTSIGEYAFEVTGLTSVTIPNSVTSIGENAFANCTNLTSVTIGDGITSIGEGAFAVTGLTSVMIPNSVTSIGDYAFSDCTGLTRVTIPNSVTSIGDYAFDYCTSLTTYFEGNAPSVDSTVFYEAHATAYYLYGTTGWSTFSADTGIPSVMLNPPPSTMLGDGFLIEISSGTSPLASYGYSILLVGNSGDSWNLIGIYNVQDDSGTYTYTNAVPYAIVIMNDATETDNNRLTFTSPTQGTFFNEITYPSAYSGLTQSGNFVAATGTAPNSIAGLNVVCSVADGHSPFAISGSYSVVFAASGNSYLMKSSTGRKISSGEYSYSITNRSTAAIQMTDSVAGAFTVYVGFSNQLSGGYAIAQPSTGGFQIGSFSGTMPPVQTGSLQMTITPAGAITAGAQWQVDGGILLNSGVETDLPVGNHTVNFNSINGWTAPDNQTISIKANAVTKDKGTYTFNGAGVYNGLFMQETATVGKAGMLASLTVTASGTYSGKLLVGASTYTIRGSFNDSGMAANIVARAAKNGGPLTVKIQMNWNNSPVNIGGTVSGTDDGAWVADLTAELALGAEASAEYTALLLTAGTPPGCGYVGMTNHAGAIVLAGSLPDGTPFSEVVPVSVNGELPIYHNLYGSTGLLIGWIGLESGSPAGNLTWIKEASGSSVLYAKGFTNLVQVQGSPWTSPSPHTAAIDLPSGQLDISGGSLVTPLSFNVAVSNNNALVKLPGGSTNSLTGSINPKTGLFTVTFGNGNAKATTRGTGAVLQNMTNAAGFFLGKTNAGTFFLQP